MVQLNADKSSLQDYFVRNFDSISSKMQTEINSKEAYPVYGVLVQAEVFSTTASKILEAVKRKMVNSSKSEIQLSSEDVKIYSSDLRPLYGIFKKAGISMSMTNEVPATLSNPNQRDIQAIIFSQQYATAEMRICLTEELLNY